MTLIANTVIYLEYTQKNYMLKSLGQRLWKDALVVKSKDNIYSNTTYLHFSVGYKQGY